MESKKILIVFRGGYTRVPNVEHVCKNIIEYIIEPLRSDNYVPDVLFSTYKEDLPKLDIYKQYLSPIQITFTNSHIRQITNFKETLHNIKSLYSQYSYIIFLRFEAIYKIPISKWNFYNKTGIFFPFKEDSKKLFEEKQWYNDNIIIISNNYFEQCANILIQAPTHVFTPGGITLHNIPTILHQIDSTIPIHCLVEGFYQSNSITYDNYDEHVSPLYILVHYPYLGKDKDLFL
jgi:hypothetical protein